MLFWLAEHLGFTGLLNLIRYQSFRTGAAVATALVIGLIIGPKFIGWLRVRQGKGQPIRADGPQTHLAKRGTPTMGGLMILTAMSLSILIWMDLSATLTSGRACSSRWGSARSGSWTITTRSAKPAPPGFRGGRGCCSNS